MLICLSIKTPTNFKSKVSIEVEVKVKIRPTVVYFDQRLGAGHSKRWSISTFSAFLLQKTKFEEWSNSVQVKKVAMRSLVILSGVVRTVTKIATGCLSATKVAIFVVVTKKAFSEI